MGCYWYDENYKLSTCTYDVGDALRTCDCDGDIDSCTLVECGCKVAFERKETNESK